MIPLRDVIPSRTTPYVTITIIVLNVLVFLYEFSLGRYINDFVFYFSGQTDRHLLRGSEIRDWTVEPLATSEG